MILRFVLKSPLGLESGYYLWIKEQAVGHTYIFPKHKEHCKNITFKGVCTKSQMSNAYIFVFLLILWLISKSIFLLTMLYWALCPESAAQPFFLEDEPTAKKAIPGQGSVEVN